MLPGLDLTHVLMLLLLGVFLFDPERLPGIVQQAARALHRTRDWLAEMNEELKADLGEDLQEFDLSLLQPREFIRRNLLEASPESPGPRPPTVEQLVQAGQAAPWDPDTT